MLRIAVVITARASLARVQTVLTHLIGHSSVEVRVILAGGALLHHYGDTERDLLALGIPVTHRVSSALAGNTLSTTAAETGLLATYLAPIFRDEQPACVITIADRHETLATAIAASYQHIPLAHIQGGEHTGSIDDKVRWSVTSLADWHFPATALAHYLLSQRHHAVFNYGCPSIDLAANTTVLPEYADHIIVLQHPVTTEVQDAADQIDQTFDAIKCFPSHPILWLWPGQDAGSDDLAKRIREHIAHHDADRFEFVRHFPARRFLDILASAACLVGNSSVGIRECSYLGTPVVNIGTRQQHRERAANVMDVGYDANAIIQAIVAQIGHGRYERSILYGDGHAGGRIALRLLSLCRDSLAERKQRLSPQVVASDSGRDTGRDRTTGCALPCSSGQGADLDRL